MCFNHRMVLRNRILAVDYGSKNIGLAMSDPLGVTVQPLPSIPNSGKREFLDKLSALITELGIQELVLGMPVNMDGTKGDPAIRMEKLLEVLRNRFEIPAEGVDERLSTVEAMEYWKTMSPRHRKKYRTIDSLAAAMILERYLKET
jgi:putative Holliday junction resolvase